MLEFFMWLLALATTIYAIRAFRRWKRERQELLRYVQRITQDQTEGDSMHK